MFKKRIDNRILGYLKDNCEFDVPLDFSKFDYVEVGGGVISFLSNDNYYSFGRIGCTNKFKLVIF